MNANPEPIIAETEEGSGSSRFRSIFVSDIHLGTRGCKADFFLHFLRETESENLFLVGDIVDGLRLRKSWYWPQAHNDVVQKLLRKARKGTKVVFIPGNHDEFARRFVHSNFGDIQIQRKVIHEAADGKRYLVLHGDEFDGIANYGRWLFALGDWAYCSALSVNYWFNVIRRGIGLPYWSLSQYLKYKVKNAVAYINHFEETMAEIAKKRKVDGIICGHIHHAEIRQIGDVVYCNDGDWVESCTALVEHFDGRMEIIRWADSHEISFLDAYAKARDDAGEGRRRRSAAAAVEREEDDLTLPALRKACASPSSRTPGFLRSMASSVRSLL